MLALCCMAIFPGPIILPSLHRDAYTAVIRPYMKIRVWFMTLNLTFLLATLDYCVQMNKFKYCMLQNMLYFAWMDQVYFLVCFM